MAFVTMVKHGGQPVMVIQFDDIAEVEYFRKQTGNMRGGVSLDVYNYLTDVYKVGDYDDL